MTRFLDEAMQCLSRQQLACADGKIYAAGLRAHSADDREAIAIVADAVRSERAFQAQAAEQERQIAQEMARAQAQADQEERDQRAQREQRETACRNVCFSNENQNLCISGAISTNQCRAMEGGDDSGNTIDIGAAQIIDNLKRAGRTLNQLGNQQVQAMRELAEQRRRAQEDAQREMQRRREQQAEAAEQRRQAAANAARAQQQAGVERQRALQVARQEQEAERERRAAEARQRLQATQEQAAQASAASAAKAKAAAAAETLRVAKAAQADAAQAKKVADAAADAQARQAFLDATARGTKLTAKMCYGDMFVVGIRPKIKPEKVSCVDLEYRVQCPGGAAIDGVGRNFVGIGTDCFTGDTFESYKVKPACSASEALVTVRKITECR